MMSCDVLWKNQAKSHDVMWYSVENQAKTHDVIWLSARNYKASQNVMWQEHHVTWWFVTTIQNVTWHSMTHQNHHMTFHDAKFVTWHPVTRFNQHRMSHDTTTMSHDDLWRTTAHHRMSCDTATHVTWLSVGKQATTCDVTWFSVEKDQATHDVMCLFLKRRKRHMMSHIVPFQKSKTTHVVMRCCHRGWPAWHVLLKVCIILFGRMDLADDELKKTCTWATTLGNHSAWEGKTG